MGTVPKPSISDAKKPYRSPAGSWVADRFFASEIGGLGTVPMTILLLCEVLKCQGIPGARKLPDI